jgi:hypothetical protein
LGLGFRILGFWGLGFLGFGGFGVLGFSGLVFRVQGLELKVKGFWVEGCDRRPEA